METIVVVETEPPKSVPIELRLRLLFCVSCGDFRLQTVPIDLSFALSGATFGLVHNGCLVPPSVVAISPPPLLRRGLSREPQKREMLPQFAN
jgi:hypothetical protein